MTSLELYATAGKIYIQQEQHQRALQQLEGQKQQVLQELQQAVEAETKAAEEAKSKEETSAKVD